jgi:hypothetical protein
MFQQERMSISVKHAPEKIVFLYIFFERAKTHTSTPQQEPEQRMNGIAQVRFD